MTESIPSERALRSKWIFCRVFDLDFRHLRFAPNFKPLSWLVSCSFHNHEHRHIYVQEVYIIHYYRLINLISLPQHSQFLSHKVNCFFGLSIFHCVQTRTIPQWVAGQGPWNDTLLLYNINDAVVTVIYTRFVFMLRELHSRFFTVILHM